MTEQRPRLFVRPRGRHDTNVHAARLVDFAEIAAEGLFIVFFRRLFFGNPVQNNAGEAVVERLLSLGVFSHGFEQGVGMVGDIDDPVGLSL